MAREMNKDFYIFESELVQRMIREREREMEDNKQQKCRAQFPTGQYLFPGAHHSVCRRKCNPAIFQCTLSKPDTFPPISLPSTRGLPTKIIPPFKFGYLPTFNY